MIQILDAGDHEISRYRLHEGENRFGSGSDCDFILKHTEPILFCVVLQRNEVYLIHFSHSDVLKQATLSQERVKMQRNMPYEMMPDRMFYYYTFKFRLIAEPQLCAAKKHQLTDLGTQIVEDFSGTMALDDLFDPPPSPKHVSHPIQFTQVCPSQQYSSTMVIGSPMKDEVDLGNDISIQDIINRHRLSMSTDQSTQTEEQHQEQPKKATLFSRAFGFQFQKPAVQQQQQKPLPESTVIDEEIDKVIPGSIMPGTVIDDELEQAFSSQANINNFSQENKSEPRVLENRSEPRVVNNSLDLNDLFASTNSNKPIIDAQRQQPFNLMKKFQRHGSILSKPSDESFDHRVGTIEPTPPPTPAIEAPIKQVDKQAKVIKEEKQQQKKVAKLNKITDQIDNKQKNKRKSKNVIDESSSEEEEREEIKNQYQLKTSGSIEMPSLNKNYLHVEKEQNLVPNKKRGLRKLFKGNEQRDVHIIAFSGFEDIPPKEQLEVLDLVLHQEGKFDILVLKECKRTFKFLSALLMGAYIVNEEWLIDSIQNGEKANFHNYIPESPSFEREYEISVKQLIENRDEYLQSNDNQVHIFDDVYYVHQNVFPSKQQIEQLLILGGGMIAKKPNRRTVIISDTEEGVRSDMILDQCMFV